MSNGDIDCFPFKIGPTGATGTAATLAVGTVTTGDPGSGASVTNSGTPQNAILDFTIPQGATGPTGPTTPVSLLSAYSTPAQPGTSGGALVFDQNGTSYGTDISHTAGSSTVTVNTPGVYSVAFHGSFSPVSGATLPQSVGVSLTQNGSVVPGATSQYIFHTSAQTAALSFSTPVAVSSVPTTLQVVGDGGNYQYSTIGLSVNRLGDIPDN